MATASAPASSAVHSAPVVLYAAALPPAAEVRPTAVPAAQEQDRPADRRGSWRPGRVPGRGRDRLACRFRHCLHIVPGRARWPGPLRHRVDIGARGGQGRSGDEGGVLGAGLARLGPVRPVLGLVLGALALAFIWSFGLWPWWHWRTLPVWLLGLALTLWILARHRESNLGLGGPSGTVSPPGPGGPMAPPGGSPVPPQPAPFVPTEDPDRPRPNTPVTGSPVTPAAPYEPAPYEADPPPAAAFAGGTAPPANGLGSTSSGAAPGSALADQPTAVGHTAWAPEAITTVAETGPAAARPAAAGPGQAGAPYDEGSEGPFADMAPGNGAGTGIRGSGHPGSGNPGLDSVAGGSATAAIPPVAANNSYPSPAVTAGTLVTTSVGTFSPASRLGTGDPGDPTDADWAEAKTAAAYWAADQLARAGVPAPSGTGPAAVGGTRTLTAGQTAARRLRRAVRILVALIAALLLLGVMMAVGVTLGSGSSLSGGAGNNTYVPLSASAVQPHYRLGAGDLNVNLSQVKFPASGQAVDVTLGVGNVTIEVPKDAVVDVHARSGIGQVDVFGQSGSNVQATSYQGAGQRSDAPHLNVDAHVGLGSLQVTQG